MMKEKGTIYQHIFCNNSSLPRMQQPINPWCYR